MILVIDYHKHDHSVFLFFSFLFFLARTGHTRTPACIRALYGWFCDRVLGSNDRRPPFYVQVRASFPLDEEQDSAKESFKRKLKESLGGERGGDREEDNDGVHQPLDNASIEAVESGSRSGGGERGSYWKWKIEDFKWETQAKGLGEGEARGSVDRRKQS